MVCKQLEHVIAGYLRQVWCKNDWLDEGQRGFRTGYSFERQVITVCQDVTYCLDEGVGIGVIIIDVSNTFEIVPNYRLLTKTGCLGRGFEGSRLGKGIPCRSYKNVKVRRATIQECQSKLTCAARECFGPTTVSSVCK